MKPEVPAAEGICATEQSSERREHDTGAKTVIWFFGPPGSGKGFCATKLSEILGVPHVDADEEQFLTREYRRALEEATLTQDMRRKKLERIRDHVVRLLEHQGHNQVVVEDSLPNRASRELLLNGFGEQINVLLVYVKTNPAVQALNLAKRKGEHFFTVDMLHAWMANWEEPILWTYVVDNTGYTPIQPQLENIARYVLDLQYRAELEASYRGSNHV